jgi:uncharacterized repeat protein (TIGR01451 family)
MKAVLTLLLLLLPGSAWAADSVRLSSEVFVEKIEAAPNGKARIVLHQPKLVVPGDRLVFILSYRNEGPTTATNFTVTNPLPTAVSFEEAPGAQAQYSVDNGRVWGALASLKLRESDGKWRAARPDDVTHVRWVLKQPLPSGTGGKLTFRGIVR